MSGACSEKSWKQRVNSRMRRFVTGGPGCIGSLIVRRFPEARPAPCGPYKPSIGHRSAMAFTPRWVEDLADERGLSGSLSSTRYAIDVHFAGAAVVAESNRMPRHDCARHTAGDAGLLSADPLHPSEILGGEPWHSSLDGSVASAETWFSRHPAADGEFPHRRYRFPGSSDNR